MTTKQVFEHFMNHLLKSSLTCNDIRTLVNSIDLQEIRFHPVYFSQIDPSQLSSVFRILNFNTYIYVEDSLGTVAEVISGYSNRCSSRLEVPLIEYILYGEHKKVIEIIKANNFTLYCIKLDSRPRYRNPYIPFDTKLYYEDKKSLRYSEASNLHYCTVIESLLRVYDEKLSRNLLVCNQDSKILTEMINDLTSHYFNRKQFLKIDDLKVNVTISELNKSEVIYAHILFVITGSYNSKSFGSKTLPLLDRSVRTKIIDREVDSLDVIYKTAMANCLIWTRYMLSNYFTNPYIRDYKDLIKFMTQLDPIKYPFLTKYSQYISIY